MKVAGRRKLRGEYMLSHVLIALMFSGSLSLLSFVYLKYRFRLVVLLVVSSGLSGGWGYVWVSRLADNTNGFALMTTVFAWLIGLQYGVIVWFFSRRQS